MQNHYTDGFQVQKESVEDPMLLIFSGDIFGVRSFLI